MKESRKPFPAARFMTSNEVNDRKLTWLIKFFVIYTLVVDQRIVLFRVLKFKRVDIS